MTEAEAPPSAGFALDAFLRRERARADAALAEVAGTLAAAVPPPLRDPLRYALGTPGKRIRPVLCVSAWRAGAGVDDADAAPAAVYRLACAVEVVHTYSLVHDDLPLMDDDDLRRGRPTVHRVHGVAPAVLAGAALIPAAVAVLDAGAGALGLAPAERAALVAALCQAGGARGMVAGQLMDLQAEARPADAAGLERIHLRKTAALLVAALRLGGMAARADEARLEALSRYGREVGLAFQIVDDVLDVTGTADALGKTAGRDLSLGKATYPSLYGIEGARSIAWERAGRAVEALRGAGIASPALEAIARYVVERER